MTTLFAPVPMQFIGPLLLHGDATGSVMAPLATFETPLWPSCDRAAACTKRAGGIQVVVTDTKMSRSILVEAKDSLKAHAFKKELDKKREKIAELCQSSSRFVRFLDLHIRQIANMLYIRLEMTTGDASGHNMVTKAADSVLSWITTNFPGLQHVSISGNLCCDKKASSINAIRGRGRSVIADCTIDRKLLKRYLKTTPEALVALNNKKNLLGSIAAGGVQTANAHFANMLLAIYLATGQDAANIVEGSQGITYAEVVEDGLYFSVSLPNIIVGTVGSGKEHPFVQENLAKMGCIEQKEPGENSKRLACIVAATVLCGELSLLAAQTNPGELISSHIQLEREQRICKK